MLWGALNVTYLMFCHLRVNKLLFAASFFLAHQHFFGARDFLIFSNFSKFWSSMSPLEYRELISYFFGMAEYPNFLLRLILNLSMRWQAVSQPQVFLRDHSQIWRKLKKFEVQEFFVQFLGRILTRMSIRQYFDTWNQDLGFLPDQRNSSFQQVTKSANFADSCARFWEMRKTQKLQSCKMTHRDIIRWLRV